MKVLNGRPFRSGGELPVSVFLVNSPSLSGPRHARESFIAGQKRRLTPRQYYSLPIEHLGLSSIAAHARSYGIPVTTVNGMVAGHRSVRETWQAIADAAAGAGRPRLIGFTTIDTFDEVRWLIERCRQEWDDVAIALGHTFATLNYRRILDSYPAIDFVLLGEGEVSFTALAEAVLEGRDPAAVPGLARRTADGTVDATAQTTVDLDTLPWPDRDELPTVLGEGFAAAVYSTRGCLYRCTFCGTGAVSDLLGRNRYRSRSVEGVVDEIERLRADFGIEFVSISDDLFLSKHPGSQERARVFADEILRRGLDISFMVDARVDALKDLGLLAHLRRAGLCRIFVGLETGSYEQLVTYRKRHVLAGEDPAARINAVSELGIEVIPGTIMFHPTVRPAELRQTLRLLDATGYRTPHKLIEQIVAYAGTPLHQDYAAKGFLTEDWPIGRWSFADPLAERAYRRVRTLVEEEHGTFAEAAGLLLAELEGWEAAEASAAVHLPADATAVRGA
jgi:Radical SAM superfamily/B12 binding domain